MKMFTATLMSVLFISQVIFAQNVGPASQMPAIENLRQISIQHAQQSLHLLDLKEQVKKNNKVILTSADVQWIKSQSGDDVTRGAVIHTVENYQDVYTFHSVIEGQQFLKNVLDVLIKKEIELSVVYKTAYFKALEINESPEAQQKLRDEITVVNSEISKLHLKNAPVRTGQALAVLAMAPMAVVMIITTLSPVGFLVFAAGSASIYGYVQIVETLQDIAQTRVDQIDKLSNTVLSGTLSLNAVNSQVSLLNRK